MLFTILICRHYVLARLLVDVSKHRHLAERAYLAAASHVERLMKLEATYTGSVADINTTPAIAKPTPPTDNAKDSDKDDTRSEGTVALITTYDIAAAELLARRAGEGLDALQRAAGTPRQINELKRVCIDNVFCRIVAPFKQRVRNSAIAKANLIVYDISDLPNEP